MKRFALMLALATAAATGGATTQQAAMAQQAAGLTGAQLEGQRLFVQHCGLCHAKIQINVPAPNGPALSKAVFDNGAEAKVKAQIANGSPNMPGYKVMFEPAQIDALVEYLKTVEPAPAKR